MKCLWFEFKISFGAHLSSSENREMFASKTKPQIGADMMCLKRPRAMLK